MDWAFLDEHRLGLHSSAWVDKAREVCRHFDHLTNRIPIQPVYHVFLATPGTFALALGAKFGRRIPVVVYQHAGMVRDPYVPVFDTENIGSHDGYHLLNQRISEYKRIEIERLQPQTDSSSGKALVILDFTGHELRKPYPDCGADDVILVRLCTSHGHIPLDADWVSIAHEIASLLYSQLDRDKQVHLLPGIPASLAFVLGTVLGTTHGVWLYHFNVHDGAYTEPFASHEL
ncbi:MAG TPA: SAVED domain-containing protein [Burkholderiales bacterium]|nr:SAVED domain-containing protein [Burkholderiales bacterium]